MDKSRLGQCYVLAGRYVMDHPKAVLVHGSIQGMGNPRIGHAWAITQSGKVWEPVTNDLWDPQFFGEFFAPITEKTYTSLEMNAAILLTKNWGPWDA